MKETIKYQVKTGKTHVNQHDFMPIADAVNGFYNDGLQRYTFDEENNEYFAFMISGVGVKEGVRNLCKKRGFEIVEEDIKESVEE